MRLTINGVEVDVLYLEITLVGRDNPEDLNRQTDDLGGMIATADGSCDSVGAIKCEQPDHWIGEPFYKRTVCFSARSI